MVKEEIWKMWFIIMASKNQENSHATILRLHLII